jgi:hypothetical protein
VTKNHGYSRYFHELAFSLNLAIVVVWGGSATTPRFVLLQRLKSLFPPHEVFSANHAAGSQPVAMGCNLSDMYMSVLRVLSKWEWTMGLLFWIGGWPHSSQYHHVGSISLPNLDFSGLTPVCSGFSSRKWWPLLLSFFMCMRNRQFHYGPPQSCYPCTMPSGLVCRSKTLPRSDQGCFGFGRTAFRPCLGGLRYEFASRPFSRRAPAES